MHIKMFRYSRVIGLIDIKSYKGSAGICGNENQLVSCKCFSFIAPILIITSSYALSLTDMKPLYTYYK